MEPISFPDTVQRRSGPNAGQIVSIAKTQLIYCGYDFIDGPRSRVCSTITTFADSDLSSGFFRKYIRDGAAPETSGHMLNLYPIFGVPVAMTTITNASHHLNITKAGAFGNFVGFKMHNSSEKIR